MSAVTKNLEKKIPLEGTFNTRDLGDLPTQEGKRIKPGKLYRSDDLYCLTPDDQMELEKMGVTIIIDYRNKSEREKRPNKKIKGAKTYVLSPDDETAAIASTDIHSDRKKIDKLLLKEEQGQLNINEDHLKESMLGFVNNPSSQKLFSEMLQIIASDPDNIVLQHCRGGKDRTGYGVALILLALGVDEEIVVKEYMLTAEYNKERNKKRMGEYEQYTSNKKILTYLASAMSVREDVIRAALAEMKKKSETPLNYIQEYLAIDDETITKLRAWYLY